MTELDLEPIKGRLAKLRLAKQDGLYRVVLSARQQGKAQEIGDLLSTIPALIAEVERLRAEKRGVQLLVDKQAEDEGLWFMAETAPEAYLQQELRRLHAEIGNPLPAGASEGEGR